MHAAPSVTYPVGRSRLAGGLLAAAWLLGAAGQPDLALDLQARMLVRWTPAQGRPLWLWVERDAALSHWDALRRALYSRTTTAASHGGPPVA